MPSIIFEKNEDTNILRLNKSTISLLKIPIPLLHISVLTQKFWFRIKIDLELFLQDRNKLVILKILHFVIKSAAMKIMIILSSSIKKDL